MKKVMITIVGMGVLLGTSAVLVPAMIDWSSYKEPVIRAVQGATGLKVQMNGPISLRILPYPAFRVQTIDLQLPEAVPETTIFKADSVSASLALFPLLTGQVQVNQINIDRPDFYLVLSKNGQPNLTPELRNLLGLNPESDDRTGSASSEDIKSTTKTVAKTPSVSIQAIKIDQGRIRILDQRNGQTQTFDQLTLQGDMGSMKGPYRADLEGIYQTVPFKATLRAGAMLDSTADVPVDLKIALPDFQTQMRFSGAASGRAGGDAQGVFEIQGRSLPQIMQKLTGTKIDLSPSPFNFSTVLSLTSRNIVADQIKLAYDKIKLTGLIKTRLAGPDFPRPLMEARLNSDEVIDLRSLIKGIAAVDKKSATADKIKSNDSGLKQKSKIESTSIPNLPLDLDIVLKSSGIQIGSVPFKNVDLHVTNIKNDWRGQVKIDDLPGQGKLDLTLYPKTNNQMMADLTLSSVNPAQFMTSGLGMMAPEFISNGQVRHIKIKTLARIDPDEGAAAESGILGWQVGEKSDVEYTVSFGGSSYQTRRGQSPLLNLTLGSRSFDLDALIGNNPTKQVNDTNSGPVVQKSKSSTSIKNTLLTATENFSLPFDLDTNLSFGALRVAGHDLKNLEAAATLKGSEVKIENLKIDDVEGAGISLNGKIGHLQKLKDINLALFVQAANGQALIKKWMPSQADLITKPSPLKIKLNYTGDLDRAAIDLDLNALGMGVVVAGPITDPLGTPSFDQLHVTTTADRAGDAIRLVQPHFTVTEPLQGPMKITADVTVKDKFYDLKNIDGQFGSMNVKGNLKADFASVRPKIAGGLNLGDVPLDALMGVHRGGVAPSNGVNNRSGSTSSSTGSKWSTVPLDTGWMRTMDIDMGITASRLTYRLWNLTETGLSIGLNNGRMKIDDIRAKMFGGAIAGTVKMNAPDAQSPLDIAAQIDITDVNAGSLTNALMNKSINRIEGQVGMKLDVQAAGSSPERLISSLSGSASSNGSQLTINGIDVAKLTSWLTTDLKPSTTLDGLMGSFMGSGTTTFEKHTGLYTLKNGQVIFDKMNFDGERAVLDTSGGLDLVRWLVDTKTTMLIKNAGNVPPLSFTFKGPLDQPAQNIMGNVFENYLQKQLGSRVEKLIDKKLGNKLNDLGLGGLLGDRQPAPIPTQNPVTPMDSPAEVLPDLPPTVEPVMPSDQPQTPSSDSSEPLKKVKPEEVLLDVLKSLE